MANGFAVSFLEVPDESLVGEGCSLLNSQNQDERPDEALVGVALI